MGTRSIRLIGRLCTLASAVLATALIASPVLGARDFTVDATPTDLIAGQPTTIAITLVNTTASDKQDTINCVQIQVASSFDISSASIQSVHGQTGAAFLAWTTIWPGDRLVTFKDPLDMFPLIGGDAPNDRAVFRIRGVANGNGQSMNWLVKAYTNSEDATSADCSGRSASGRLLNFLRILGAFFLRSSF